MLLLIRYCAISSSKSMPKLQNSSEVCPRWLTRFLNKQMNQKRYFNGGRLKLRQPKALSKRLRVVLKLNRSIQFFHLLRCLQLVFKMFGKVGWQASTLLTTVTTIYKICHLPPRLICSISKRIINFQTSNLLRISVTSIAGLKWWKTRKK